jgi:hypothetical protein
MLEFAIQAVNGAISPQVASSTKHGPSVVTPVPCHAPPIDPAVDDALEAFIAQKRAVAPDAWH